MRESVFASNISVYMHTCVCMCVFICTLIHIDPFWSTLLPLLLQYIDIVGE